MKYIVTVFGEPILFHRAIGNGRNVYSLASRRNASKFPTMNAAIEEANFFGVPNFVAVPASLPKVKEGA